MRTPVTGRKGFASKFDARVGKGAEKVGRFVSRRSALRTAILTGAATLGSVALGQSPAFAKVTCPDVCGPSPLCPHGSCPTLGCPAHHSLCKVRNGHNPCPNLCVWPTGTWVHCTGYGKCGHGFKLCQDCKPHGSCNICICISGVLCKECCTAADVRSEQRRISEAIASA